MIQPQQFPSNLNLNYGVSCFLMKNYSKQVCYSWFLNHASKCAKKCMEKLFRILKSFFDLSRMFYDCLLMKLANLPRILQVIWKTINTINQLFLERLPSIEAFATFFHQTTFKLGRFQDYQIFFLFVSILISIFRCLFSIIIFYLLIGKLLKTPGETWKKLIDNKLISSNYMVNGFPWSLFWLYKFTSE